MASPPNLKVPLSPRTEAQSPCAKRHHPFFTLIERFWPHWHPFPACTRSHSHLVLRNHTHVSSTLPPRRSLTQPMCNIWSQHGTITHVTPGLALQRKGHEYSSSWQNICDTKPTRTKPRYSRSQYSRYARLTVCRLLTAACAPSPPPRANTLAYLNNKTRKVELIRRFATRGTGARDWRYSRACPRCRTDADASVSALYTTVRWASRSGGSIANTVSGSSASKGSWSRDGGPPRACAGFAKSTDLLPTMGVTCSEREGRSHEVASTVQRERREE